MVLHKLTDPLHSITADFATLQNKATFFFNPCDKGMSGLVTPKHLVVHLIQAVVLQNAV